MRIFTGLLISMSAIAVPAYAQSGSPSLVSGDYYVADPLAWSYAPTRVEERRRLINRVREVCDSRSYGDKVRCSNALAIIKAGYVELQARRAAESLSAD